MEDWWNDTHRMKRTSSATRWHLTWTHGLAMDWNQTSAAKCFACL